MAHLHEVKKRDKKTGKTISYRYIAESFQDAEGKNKKRMLKSLGRISTKQAQIELVRFNDTPEDVNDADRLFIDVYNEFDEYYKARVGSKLEDVKKKTYELFIYSSDYFVEYFKNFKLNQIDWENIEKFKRKLFELSPTTKNSILLNLNKVFKYAIQKSYQISSRFKIDKVSDKRDKEIDRLVEKDIVTLFDECSSNLKFYIRFVLLTGLRPMEFKQLTWDDINFEDRSIKIRKIALNKPGRILPITDQLNQLLLDWKKSFMGNNKNISPWETDSARRSALRRLSKRTGIPLYPYLFRKTYGSTMAENGVDRGMLAELMGHTIATGEKFYINIRHQHLRESAEKITI